MYFVVSMSPISCSRLWVCTLARSYQTPSKKWFKLPPCLARKHKGGSLTAQPDCAKSPVVCGTVYEDMSYKDLLRSIARVGYCFSVKRCKAFDAENHSNDWLVGWLCFTSHRQRGHLETAPPFTVPCEGHEAQSLHRSHQESNPGPSRSSPVHYHYATPAPPLYWINQSINA